MNSGADLIPIDDPRVPDSIRTMRSANFPVTHVRPQGEGAFLAFDENGELLDLLTPEEPERPSFFVMAVIVLILATALALWISR